LVSQGVAAAVDQAPIGGNGAMSVFADFCDQMAR